MIDIFEWAALDNSKRDKILKRAEFDVEKILPIAREWIEEVRKNGDEALLAYIRKFDNEDFSLENLRVSEDDINESFKKIDKNVLIAIKKQIDISRKFHKSQLRNEMVLQKSIDGVIIGKKITAIDSAGLYVPAGVAPLPTVMQILGVASKTAGVKRIVACFPPRFDCEAMIVAGKLAGVDEMYRVGGIAGIAAMAYGTESIRPVVKIAGPGSPFVQAAKLEVFGKVGIDMVAGPSEALILADSGANPRFIAIDILARCEHSTDASAVLATDDKNLCEEVKKEIAKIYKKLNRKDIIKKALKNYSALLYFETKEKIIDFANLYSPEHLEIQMRDPWDILPSIKNAGSIFLGDNAPVAIGDYASGTNHILPTGNFPKMFSPVSVATFQKESEIQYLSKKGISGLWDIVDNITQVEGLDAHRESVRLRIEED